MRRAVRWSSQKRATNSLKICLLNKTSGRGEFVCGDKPFSAAPCSCGFKAHHLFNRDIEYIVQNKKIVLIDEHTGRTMEGRRLSEGLHQALEAKEKSRNSEREVTPASTIFQNYFRLYGKLSGMTGTADTEAFEFSQIYGLDVVVIPTNVPMVRGGRE